MERVTATGCPVGGKRCPEWVCDCFIDLYPEDPLGLHPEAFAVGTPDPATHPTPPPAGAGPTSEGER